MNALPAILAGPILRRVETDRVTIWIALSEEIKLQPALYGFTGEQYKELECIAECYSVRISARCQLLWYILPIRLQTEESYTKFGFDLFYWDGSQRGASLLGSDVDNRSAYCLKGEAYPSFLMQQKSEALRLAYGSCRKLHATSGADAGVHLLSGIESDERPHAAFFCGDQIYADDVAEDILDGMYRSGLIDFISDGNSGSPSYVPADKLPSSIGFRPDLIAEHSAKSGFSSAFSSYEAKLSGDKKSSKYHLASWWEYVSLYLVTWNPELLQLVLNSASRGYGRPHSVQAESRALKDAFENNKAYKKIFANVPCYMVADDHEVTDDWNFNDVWPVRKRNTDEGDELSDTDYEAYEAWKTNSESDLLRDILLYGQLSYLLFQATGNLAKAPFEALMRHLGATPNKPSDLATSKDIAAIATTIFSAIDNEQQQIYSYAIPSEPRCVVLDTRCERKLGINREGYASLRCPVLTQVREDKRLVEKLWWRPVNRRQGRLLSDRQLPWLRKEFAACGDVAVLITPTPVLALPLIERMQEVAPLRLDREGWLSNPDDLDSLLSSAISAGTQTLIILSGDVHYAYRAKASAANEQRSIQIQQLVSSGMKNANLDVVRLIEHAFGAKSLYLSYHKQAAFGSDALLHLTEHSIQGSATGDIDSVRLAEYIDKLNRHVPTMERSQFRLKADFSGIRRGEARVFNMHNIGIVSVHGSTGDLDARWIDENGGSET